MANLELTFDATLLVQAYKKGLEDGFLLIANTNELDSELNKNKIDNAK